MDLTNYQDVFYYGPLQLGTDDQTMTFNFDTGSGLFWYPLSNCSGCTPTPKTFNHVTGGATVGSTDCGISYLDGSYANGISMTI